METEDLALVCTVKSPTEAEIIRAALQQVGIAAVVGGQGQAGFAGVFEIDVLAPANEVAEAKKYLRKLRRQKIARKKKRLEARQAKSVEGPSEAIQEGPPPKPPPEA